MNPKIAFTFPTEWQELVTDFLCMEGPEDIALKLPLKHSILEYIGEEMAQL